MTAAVGAAMPATTLPPIAPPPPVDLPPKVQDTLTRSRAAVQQADRTMDSADSYLRLALQYEASGDWQRAMLFADHARMYRDQAISQRLTALNDLYSVFGGEQVKARIAALEADPKSSLGDPADEVFGQIARLNQRVNDATSTVTKLAPTRATVGGANARSILTTAIEGTGYAASAASNAESALRMLQSGDRRNAYFGLSSARQQLAASEQRATVLLNTLATLAAMPQSPARDELYTVTKRAYLELSGKNEYARGRIEQAAAPISRASVSDGWNAVYSLYRSASTAMQYVNAHDRTTDQLDRYLQRGGRMSDGYARFLSDRATQYASRARELYQEVSHSFQQLDEMARALPDAAHITSWRDYGTRVIEIVRPAVDRIDPQPDPFDYRYLPPTH